MTINKLWQILSGIGVAMSGRENVDFRVGQWWQTVQEDDDKTTVFLPIKEILEHRDNLPALVGGVIHEAGHVFDTRFHKFPFFEKLIMNAEFPDVVHLFFNVLEDMYQEHARKQRWPGTDVYLTQLQNFAPEILA